MFPKVKYSDVTEPGINRDKNFEDRSVLLEASPEGLSLLLWGNWEEGKGFSDSS